MVRGPVSPHLHLKYQIYSIFEMRITRPRWGVLQLGEALASSFTRRKDGHTNWQAAARAQCRKELVMPTCHQCVVCVSNPFPVHCQTTPTDLAGRLEEHSLTQTKVLRPLGDPSHQELRPPGQPASEHTRDGH